MSLGSGLTGEGTSNENNDNFHDAETGTTADKRLFGVSVKIPPFWAEDPNIWFIKVESQFITCGITQDETKFHHIVASLDGKILQQVTEAVMNPPAEDKYKNLKEQLVQCFADSEQKKLQKLLSLMELGDSKPSNLLNKLRSLSNNKVGDAMLKSLWMNRLPSQVNAILQASSVPLAELAILADRIMECGQFSQISATQTSSLGTKTTDSSEIGRLEASINELTRQFQQFSHAGNSSKQYRDSSRQRDPSSSRSRPRDSTPARSRSNICWYHERFGPKATKCSKSCLFESQVPDSSKN